MERKSFVSPRAALIYQPSALWSYKFLYGRAFRNPNAFDLFYNDGLAAIGNPNLRPEKADTFEIDVERKIGKRASLTTAAYGYRLRDFQVGVYTDSGLLQTQNAGGIHAMGFEIEASARPVKWLQGSASYSIQQSRDEDLGSSLVNSPTHMAKLRLAVPLGRFFDLSNSMQYYSSRKTLANASVDPLYLSDFTLTSKRLFSNVDLTFGIRNAFNRKYSDPIALNPREDTMRQPGRSFFVEFSAHAAQ